MSAATYLVFDHGCRKIDPALYKQNSTFAISLVVRAGPGTMSLQYLNGDTKKKKT